MASGAKDLREIPSRTFTLWDVRIERRQRIDVVVVEVANHAYAVPRSHTLWRACAPRLEVLRIVAEGAVNSKPFGERYHQPESPLRLLDRGAVRRRKRCRSDNADLLIAKQERRERVIRQGC